MKFIAGGGGKSFVWIRSSVSLDGMHNRLENDVLQADIPHC